MRNLLETVQTIAPRAGWNAETDEKFIRASDGSFYRYSPVLDAWFYGIGNHEEYATESQVSVWIAELAAAIGYIPVNSIVIPDEFVDICQQWYSGQNCMLYAVASTGNLTLGTLRRYDTEEQCYLHIWRCLSIDVSRAVRAAKGKKGVSILRCFEKFVNQTCSDLSSAYQLEDWDD